MNKHIPMLYQFLLIQISFYNQLQIEKYENNRTRVILCLLWLSEFIIRFWDKCIKSMSKQICWKDPVFYKIIKIYQFSSCNLDDIKISLIIL